MARLTKSGYGQVELNNVAFRRDGRIEAQCKLDATDFASVVLPLPDLPVIPIIIYFFLHFSFLIFY